MKILIIIPAFNESGNIKKTIEDVLAVSTESCKLNILVVNDGSTDSTASQAGETPVAVVTLPLNLGIGGAVQTGFQYALRYDYDIALQVDGDGQHDARFIKDLIEPIKNNEVDVTIGSRFLRPFLGYRSSFVRRIGIHFFAYLISFLLKCQVTDPTSGFRAYNKKAIRIFADHYPTDYPEPESIVAAVRAGLRLKEVPVEMRKRIAGQSSIRYVMTLYYMIKVTFAILLNMIKRRKDNTVKRIS